MKPVSQFAIIAMLLLPSALADEPPLKKSNQANELTEGLTDLLNTPAKNDSSAPQKSPATRQAQDKTVDGEDIGQAPSNPLSEVQLGMNTLAGWMRSRPNAARTKQLQRDVVLRLDELISQLENQSSSASSSSSSTSSASQPSQSSPDQASAARDPAAMPDRSQSSSVQSNNTQGKSTQIKNSQPGNADKEQQGPNGQPQAGNSDKPSDSNQTGNSSSEQGQPGVSPMGSRAVVVDLNDPRALQRSAWGNLPERTREQMQSRMVERFLPPYRDEIEAYYRALVK